MEAGELLRIGGRLSVAAVTLEGVSGVARRCGGIWAVVVVVVMVVMVMRW